jgi:GrpB-like predicted nucleotidyltransferase (UPF0157 family)
MEQAVHLRQHASVAHEYAALEKSLAEQYEDDPLGYTDARTEFITGVLRTPS